MKQFILLILVLVISLGYIGGQTKKKQIEEATVTYKRKPTTPAKTVAPTPTQTTKEKQTSTATPSAANPSSVATSSEINSATPVTTPAKTPPPTPKEKMDTIIKLGGKKIICNVIKTNPTTVQYQKPESPAFLEIARKDIEKIHYGTGRMEPFNKPIFATIDKSQWQAVMVTENAADVEGLYQVAPVKAKAQAGSRSPKQAKSSATISLQKKTANLGALIVLVIKSESKGGYGEIPGWELQGIAYSDTPPKDTAAVNKAIRQMIAKNQARINDAKKK
jgi:hypothetical protein